MDTGEISLLQLIVLAAVQGTTEFLPISSSAHLILVPALTGWPDQGLTLDVAMHIGTLLAVVLYFHRDVSMLIAGAADALRGRRTGEARVFLQLVVATTPVVVAGFLLKDRIESDWRSPVLIMVTTAALGVLLWIVDRRADRAEGTIDALTWRDVALIGAAQALALVPGVSRSGITMTVALLLGQRRPEAARFSLLLSIRTTAAAGFLGAMESARAGRRPADGRADRRWTCVPERARGDRRTDGLAPQSELPTLHSLPPGARGGFGRLPGFGLVAQLQSELKQ